METSVHRSVESSQVLRFGVFELDRRARELRKQGLRIRLQDQPFQVLTFLLERAGDIITREEFRQKLWPSSVYVDFDHGLNNTITRLRDVLGDDAGAPHFIETMPRHGYRFIFPVEGVPSPDARDARESGLPGGSSSAAHVPEGGSKLRWHAGRPRLLHGVVAALAALGLLTWSWLARQSPGQQEAGHPKEPSIAVLPFVNMSDDMGKEHFADGLSEELLNKLAGIRGLKVAGRTSSFYFKDKQVLPSVIAETLNVDNLLEGSVRRSGSRVRVTVQLIDGRNGFHRWSQTYDRDLADILQVQEDIAFAVTTALQVKLLDADKRRLRNRSTQDAEAYRLYLTARTLLKGEFIMQDPERARQLLEEALARDPGFAAAHAGLALVHFQAADLSLDTVEEDSRLGRAAAERAVTLDPESSEALTARANFEYLQYRFRDDAQAYAHAQEDFRRAIELDPSSSDAFFSYGRAVQWDELDLAQNLFERAVELDPLWDHALGFSASMLNRRGRHDAARSRLREWSARSLDRGGVVFYSHLGRLESQLGRLDEALAYMKTPPALGGQIQRWSMYMSLDDREAARKSLEDIGGSELADDLREAASFNMDGRSDAAFAALDRHRKNFPLSHVLDLPTARQALIAGHPERALPILEQRLPGLASGAEPVRARNVIPALDLAAAYAGTGRDTAANGLLSRIGAYLDGTDAPHLPMFTFLRARTHALAQETDLALRTLDRAFDEGFRLLWALDLSPQPLFYVDSVDVDPAFTSLRTEQRFKSWRERISSDNAGQLDRVRARDAATPGG